MARQKLRTKGPRSKARTRVMNERLADGTVRVLEGKDLPTGCCVTRKGIPCTYRMEYVGLKVERRWQPETEALESVIKMLGYCKSHRPKLVTDNLLELPSDVSRKVNGPKSTKQRIKRMEDAMYVEVVPQGGAVKHLVERSEVKGLPYSGWHRDMVTTLCGKRMKQAYVPTLAERRTEYVKQCPKCHAAKTVAE